jgi:hypothetical protein
VHVVRVFIEIAILGPRRKTGVGMRLAMIIGAWCAALCFCAHDDAFAQCKSGALDAFCDHAAADPFDTSRPVGGETSRHGARDARPAMRRKITRVSPISQAQVNVAGPKVYSREALYQKCKNALYSKYAFTGVYDGRVTRLMYTDRLGPQIDSCVANGGNPI